MEKRQLLMEGYQESWHPTVGFVQQEGRAHFFFGGPSDLLVEAIDPAIDVVDQLDLFETIENPLLQEAILEELRTDYGVPEERVQEIAEMVRESTRRTIKNARWIIEGPYQRWETENANKRRYRYKTWERIADPAGQTMKMMTEKPGGLLGHLEHPLDGRTDGNKGALSTRGLKLLEKEKIVWGKSELFDTPAGLILQEYTRRRQRYGISSRGNGTVGADGWVAEDFDLKAFDAVMNPSTPGANTKQFKLAQSEGSAEQKKATRTMVTVSKKLDELDEDAQTLVEEVQQLSETNLEKLDEAERHVLTGRLTDALLQANSLRSAGTLPDDKAAEMQNWLAKKLREVHEAGPPGVDALLNQAIQGSDDGSTQDRDAFGQIIQTLHRRLREVAEENGTLSDRVEELEAQQDDLDALREQSEQANELLQSVGVENDTSRAQLEQLQTELDIATTSLAEAYTQPPAPGDDERTVNQAMQSVIQEVPELEAFQETLGCATTADGVITLAETLMPAVLDQRSVRRSTAESIDRRRLLPSGVLVESERNIGPKGGNTRASKSVSPGAQLAGAIVGKKKG